MTDTPFRERGPISTPDALRLLDDGELTLVGRMPWSSNATFLVDLAHQGRLAQGIYKPARGERPLWDFPDGLYRREVAAFALSEQLGWTLVPPTVVRDGPHGEGSVQLFVPADFDEHYFTLIENPDHHAALQRICVFDYVSNNTDRKSGHCLAGHDGQIWAIDNGLSFHAEFKLRTVIWEFGGDPLPADIGDDLARLLDRGLAPGVAEALNTVEIDAVLDRARQLLQEQRFPIDPGGRRYPWPLV